MKASIVLILCFGLMACTATPQPEQHAVVAGAVRCIPLDQVVTRRLAGADALDFELLGGVTYRNQLESACPGAGRLGDTAIVAVSAGAETGRLCAGDKVKIFDPVEAKATGLQSYPECRLGQFLPTPQR